MKNKIISFILVVVMLLCGSASVFATNSNVSQSTKPSEAIEAVDSSTEAINPSAESLTAFKRDSITVTTSSSIVLNEIRSESTPGKDPSVSPAGGTEYPFGKITLATYTDLRTITVQVETIDSITPIISFGAMLTIKDYYGNITSSKPLGGATLFYDNTWTFTIPITSTVEETIILSNINVTYNLKTYNPTDLKLTRTNQIGGSYNSIISAMGGERHHLIAEEVISSATVYKYNSQRVKTGTVTTGTAPCILMTPEDHRKTASWGSSTAAKNYRNNQLSLIKQGKYVTALQNDINDIESKCGDKYDDAIAQMWQYVLFNLYWYQ